MEKKAAAIFREALALPPEGRAALVDSLLESLDREVDEDAQEAWLAEIQKRLKKIDDGSVELIPWEEAEHRLWARLQPK